MICSTLENRTVLLKRAWWVVLLLSLGACGKDEPPPAKLQIEGTWLGPCEETRVIANTSTRVMYTFGPRGALQQKFLNWEVRDCTGTVDHEIVNQGTYQLGTDLPGGGQQIDLSLPRRVPGDQQFQIFVIEDNTLYFGNLWAEVRSARTDQLNRSRPFQRIN